MSEGTTEQNAAILSRLKDLLNQQIEQFHSYLAALEKQEAAIEMGGVENILAYIEIEERAVNDIFGIQKVIDPLVAMCCTAVGSDDIAALQAELENLKNRAVSQADHNRDILSARMAAIGMEISVLRNNPLAAAARRSLYHSTTALIDIQG